MAKFNENADAPLPTVQMILSRSVLNRETTPDNIAYATGVSSSTATRWITEEDHDPKLRSFQRIVACGFVAMRLRRELFDWFAFPPGFRVTVPEATDARSLDADGNGSIDDNDTMLRLCEAADRATKAMRAMLKAKAEGRRITAEDKANARVAMFSAALEVE